MFLKISLWPQMTTLNLEIFSIKFYTESYQQTSFWLRLGLKNRISVIYVIMSQTRYYIIYGYAHNKGILATSNSFTPRNLWNTNVSIELNKRNTVFNTNIEEFPLEIIHFILLFTSIISTAVNGLIICQQLKL
jgi:hypothetical protein